MCVKVSEHQQPTLASAALASAASSQIAAVAICQGAPPPRPPPPSPPSPRRRGQTGDSHKKCRRVFLILISIWPSIVVPQPLAFAVTVAVAVAPSAVLGFPFCHRRHRRSDWTADGSESESISVSQRVRINWFPLLLFFAPRFRMLRLTSRGKTRQLHSNVGRGGGEQLLAAFIHDFPRFIALALLMRAR